MQDRLAGKTAIITGGGGRIGAATARRLHRASRTHFSHSRTCCHPLPQAAFVTYAEGADLELAQREHAALPAPADGSPKG